MTRSSVSSELRSPACLCFFDPVPTDHTFTTELLPIFYFHSNPARDATPILNAWFAQYQLPRLSNVLGTVESFDIAHATISGWAVDRSQVNIEPCVDVWVNNSKYLGCALPGTNRSDVEAGTGIAQAGFTFKISDKQMKDLNDGGCYAIDVYAVARTPGGGSAKTGSPFVSTGRIALRAIPRDRYDRRVRKFRLGTKPLRYVVADDIGQANIENDDVSFECARDSERRMPSCTQRAQQPEASRIMEMLSAASTLSSMINPTLVPPQAA